MPQAPGNGNGYSPSIYNPLLADAAAGKLRPDNSYPINFTHLLDKTLYNFNYGVHRTDPAPSTTNNSWEFIIEASANVIVTKVIIDIHGYTWNTKTILEGITWSITS